MPYSITTRIWEQSKQPGTNRLVLLAIADHADQDGVCWPGIEKLAEKTMLSSRQVMRNIKAIEAGGELYIQVGRGRHISNKYFITVGLTISEIQDVLIRRFEIDPNEALKIAENVTSGAEKGDTHVTISDRKNVTSMAEKVTPRAEKVTSVTEKGDMDDTRTIMEPSVIISKPSDSLPDKKQEQKKKARSPTEKQLQARAMFGALISLCQYDLDMITKELRMAVNQASKGLREKGKTPDDLKEFSAWWYANDWRGKQNQPPTLRQIRETWGQYQEWVKQGRPAPVSDRSSSNGHNQNNQQQQPAPSQFGGLTEAGRAKLARLSR